MHLMYFTEQPMSAYPTRRRACEFGATALMFSNKHFDPVAGSRLYNEYLEHYMLAEEVGIDGIMLNEHHNAPFCMQAKANIFAAILAAVTKRVKIVMLGNPLPLADNPVRLAEELAMIDMISKGRLVSGFVRGGGQEQLADRRQPGLQPRALRGGARPDRQGLDRSPARSAGRARTTSTASSTRGRCRCRSRYPRVWIPGVHQQGDDHLGGAAALSLHRAEHRDRRDQEDLGALRPGGGRGRLRRPARRTAAT